MLFKSQVLEIAGVWKDITVDTQKETLERIPLLTIAWVLVILLQIADQISLKLLEHTLRHLVMQSVRQSP